MAYLGSELILSDLLYVPKHSLIVQSRQSRMGTSAACADGFGVAWYDGVDDEPILFKSPEPAWRDRNLRELSKRVISGAVMAHVRAASVSSGCPVQRTNCHPFPYKQWLFMHNGGIRNFPEVKSDLILGVNPMLYPFIEGSSDSEIFFYLAITFGLEKDPLTAMARTVGFIERVGREKDIENPIQMTVAITDGKTLWAFRYSSEGKSRTLFYSNDKAELMEEDPDDELLARICLGSRMIVSEPIGDQPELWSEVPESSCVVVVEGGKFRIIPFKPILLGNKLKITLATTCATVDEMRRSPSTISRTSNGKTISRISNGKTHLSRSL
jgi:predicted glutamine amidotransferase